MLHWFSRAAFVAALGAASAAGAGTYQVSYRLDVDTQYLLSLGAGGLPQTTYNPVAYTEFGTLTFAYDAAAPVAISQEQFGPTLLQTTATKPLTLIQRTPSFLEPILLSLQTLSGLPGATTTGASGARYENVFGDFTDQPDISLQFLRFRTDLDVFVPGTPERAFDFFESIVFPGNDPFADTGDFDLSEAALLARLAGQGFWTLRALRTEGVDVDAIPFTEYVGAEFQGRITVLDVTQTDVPEPGSLALLATGLALLARRRT